MIDPMELMLPTPGGYCNGLVTLTLQYWMVGLLHGMMLMEQLTINGHCMIRVILCLLYKKNWWWRDKIYINPDHRSLTAGNILDTPANMNLLILLQAIFRAPFACLTQIIMMKRANGKALMIYEKNFQNKLCLNRQRLCFIVAQE